MKNSVNWWRRRPSAVPPLATTSAQASAGRHWSRIATVCVMVVAALPFIARGQFHEKRETRIADSAGVQNVKGGSSFETALAYEKTYEAAINYLKRHGYTIDSASVETGQIITAMDIKGGYRQAGTRIQITCIKDSDTQTSVRVLVTEQKRTKLLQTEPWNGAKANDGASSKMADEIKAAIGNGGREESK
jgi:hypothetical protein